MSLLGASVVENSTFLAGVYFIFLKAFYSKLESLSIPNFVLSEKTGKVVIK